MRRHRHFFIHFYTYLVAFFLLFLVSFTPFILYKLTLSKAHSQNISIEENIYNEWNELIVSPGMSGASKVEDTLNRAQYSIELLHFLGLNTSTIREIESYDEIILVFGSKTIIGTELINLIEKSTFQKNEKKLIVKIRSLVEIDLSSKDIYYLFQHLRNKISKSIIVYQPLYLFDKSENDDSRKIEKIISDELNSIQNFLEEMKIEKSFFIIQPPHFEIYETILSHHATFFIPFLIDDKNIQDAKNEFSRVTFQCKMSHQSEIVYYKNGKSHQFLSAIPIEKVARFIYSKLIDSNYDSKGGILLYSKSDFNARKAKEVIESAMNHDMKIRCEIKLKKSPHHVIKFVNYSKIKRIKFDDESVEISGSISKLRYDAETTYLSIVFTGRNDDYGKGFIERSKYFLTYLYRAVKDLHSILNIEIVIVDYATSETMDPLHSIFSQFLNDLKKNYRNKNEIKIRFIQVPEKFHSKLVEAKVPFLEYFAKNIGIRRSKGEFILAMNPDSLLSRFFFELVSCKYFNPGFLYTSTRIDMKEEDCETIETKEKFIQKVFEEPNVYLNNSPLNPYKNLSQKADRKYYYNKLEFIRLNFNYDWGYGDFEMMSKKLWYALNGFNQLPTNTYVDNLLFAKMLKIRPGAFAMNLQAPIIHQYHTHMSSKRPHNIDIINISMNNYQNLGWVGKSCENTDADNWGFPNEDFPEVIYVI